MRSHTASSGLYLPSLLYMTSLDGRFSVCPAKLTIYEGILGMHWECNTSLVNEKQCHVLGTLSTPRQVVKSRLPRRKATPRGRGQPGVLGAAKAIPLLPTSGPPAFFC